MSTGLDDVIAATTVMSHVDGAAGRLIVRGYDLDELAQRFCFEDVLSLLWDGVAEDVPDDMAAALGQARVDAFAVLEECLPLPVSLSAVEQLRYLLSALPDTVPAAKQPLLAVAATAVFTAAILRLRDGKSPIAPDRSLEQAHDFLRMLRNESVPAHHAKALDTYLVTVADHGLNASTFAARTIASTQAGLFSSIVGGLCALKGPLHGGAPGPVLDMLDAIGTADNASDWLTQAVESGERLMGFGHRVYRVRDPRADVLKRVAKSLREDSNRIKFAEQVESAALTVLADQKKDRVLETNVEFYTALVLEALRLPRESFTMIFAMGRVAGWTAHLLEQLKHGRLIRPLSEYTGPMPQSGVAAE